LLGGLSQRQRESPAKLRLKPTNQQFQRMTFNTESRELTEKHGAKKFKAKIFARFAPRYSAFSVAPCRKLALFVKIFSAQNLNRLSDWSLQVRVAGQFLVSTSPEK
jgi:hypothetical protein